MNIYEPLLLTAENDMSNENTKQYIESVKAFGWQYRVTGQGKVFAGMISKQLWFKEELLKLSPDQLVVLTDARDVCCVRSPNDFYRAFASFGASIVVSMEMFCDGYLEYKGRVEGSQCADLAPYWAGKATTPVRKFVNAGLMAGTAKALLHFIEWAVENNFTNDQLAFGHYFLAHPHLVAPDTEATLLHTSSAGVNGGTVHLDQLKDSPSLAELTGRGAYFLHIPGLSASKGQAMFYEIVRDLKPHMLVRTMNANYGSPPPWRKVYSLN